jgi:hypothetical protein
MTPLPFLLALLATPAAADAPPAGVFRVVAAVAAPWVTPGLPPAGTPFLPPGSELSFHPDRVEATHPLGCKGAVYVWIEVPPEGLFQGGLGEEGAREIALALGLGDTSPTLRVQCDSGLFDYHAAGPDLWLALDGVLYRLSLAP